MTIGPLQLLLVKFDDEQRTRPISEELKAVRKAGVIRLVDMLYVYKDPEGVLHTKQVSDLLDAQKAEYGLILKGLLGMRAAYKTGAEVDEIASAMSLSPGDFGISSEQVQQMASNLPNGGSAMLTLFEHVWAVRLKEALLNAGGEMVAQGLISPETMAIGGTTLEDAMAAAQKIEAEAENAVAAEVAEADQKLAQARAEAEAKIAEAQRVLDDANAQVAERMEQARIVAAATIAASVRTAAGELQQADEQLELSKQESAAKVAEGEAIARQEIEQGIKTAEEIKSAAVIEALRILVEAQLVRRESANQAFSTLVSASMIEKEAAQKYFADQRSSGSS